MLKRHRVLWKILRPLVIVFLYIKFGYTFKTAKDLPSNFLLLSNHNTDFDPLFVGVSFRENIRFVASEHISRWKNAFKFVNYIFNPIMRYKGTNAASTVKEMLNTAREGNNVGLFAEGARSWNGITAPILPSTGKVVKSAKCALVTYKITGGYFVSPMWSKGGTRRGKIHGEVVNVYTAEQISQMTTSEINEIIRRDLHEDAYETQANLNAKYTGRKLAEQMETMLYVCPNCGKIDTLKSKKNNITCTSCNHNFTFDKFGNIHGIDHRNVKELFLWLKETAENDALNNIEYAADFATLSTVAKHVVTSINSGKLVMNKEYIKCAKVEIPLSEITDFAMHGRNALVLSTKDSYYEIIVSEEFSALKFYMLFQAHKFGCVNRFSF